MSTQTRKYELKARAESQRETRDRIAAAAAELHEEVGVANTTVADIARRAGVTRLTVYNHFADLSELLPACSAHYAAQHPRPDLGAAFALEDPVAAGPRRARGHLRLVPRDRADAGQAPRRPLVGARARRVHARERRPRARRARRRAGRRVRRPRPPGRAPAGADRAGARLRHLAPPRPRGPRRRRRGGADEPRRSPRSRPGGVRSRRVGRQGLHGQGGGGHRRRVGHRPLDRAAARPRWAPRCTPPTSTARAAEAVAAEIESGGRQAAAPTPSTWPTRRR